MPELSPTLRRRFIVAGVLVAITAAVLVAWTIQNRSRQRRMEACRQQRNEISRFREERFDAQLAQMRQMRLNTEQVKTLRRVDPAAYARYAQAYGDQVDRVAQAADQLGRMVDEYRDQDCLSVE